MLDPAEPDLLYPVFAEAIAILEGMDDLDKFRRVGNACADRPDGTEYFTSKKIHLSQLLDAPARQGYSRLMGAMRHARASS